MENEKFGVQIFIDLVQSSVQKAKNDVRNAKAAIQQAVSDVKLGIQLKDIGNVKILSSELDRIKNSKFVKLGMQFATLKNRIQGCIGGLREMFDQLKDTNTKTTMEGLVDGAKRFALALIGARTVFAGIRKAMSTYLAQNDELQNKLNACWYALGSLFAPVLEKIVNLFIKLVSYVNIFLKALGFAGINMSNFNKSTGSALKNIEKMKGALAGFDEINNIGQEKSEPSGGGAGGGNPFEGVELDPEKIKKIQSFAEWVKNNGPLIAGIIAGIATAIFLVKSGIAGLLEGGQIAGIILIVSGITMAIVALLDYLKDPTWKSFGEIITGIGIAIVGVGLLIGSTPVIVAGVIVAIAGILASHLDQVNAFFENIKGKLNNALTWVHTNITTKFGIFGALLGSLFEIGLIAVNGFIQTVQDLLNGLFTGVRQILDGIISIFRGHFKEGFAQILQGIVTLVKTALTTIKDVLSTMFSAIKTLVSNLFSSIGTTVQTKIKSIINSYIISPINRLIDWVNSKLAFDYGGLRIAGVQVIEPFSVKLAHIGSIPSLDVGTNYVPNDQLAMVHQGEAIIPKRFNSEEFFEQGSEETNDLLRELIEVIQKKDFDVNLDGRSLTRTVSKYQHSMARELGGAL